MTDSALQGEVCIANISPRERRLRLVSGIVPTVIALVVLPILVGDSVNRWWRLLLLPLFWVAGSGYFQWRDKT